MSNKDAPRKKKVLDFSHISGKLTVKKQKAHSKQLWKEERL